MQHTVILRSIANTNSDCLQCFHLSLESTTALPVIPLDKIVERIQTLKIRPTSEDNESLRDMLGQSQYVM